MSNGIIQNFTDGSLYIDGDGITITFHTGTGDKRHLHLEEMSYRAAFEILVAAVEASLSGKKP